MTKSEQILNLQAVATMLTGLPPVADKEYVRLTWHRSVKGAISNKSSRFKSKRKRI